MAAPLEDVELWNRLLGEIRTGKQLTAAARSVGMHKRAVLEYLRTHPERRLEFLEAEEEATEKVEERLYEAAAAGEPWAVKMWLPQRWADRWAVQGVGQSAAGAIETDPDALLELNS